MAELRWPSGLRRHCLAEQFLQVAKAVQTLSLTKFIIYHYSEAIKPEEPLFTLTVLPDLNCLLGFCTPFCRNGATLEKLSL